MKKKKGRKGVPAVAQWDWRHPGTTGMQVRSPAGHSGLRILCCCSCGLGLDCGSDLISGPGTSYAAKNEKKKKRLQEKRKTKERGREEGRKERKF